MKLLHKLRNGKSHPFISGFGICRQWLSRNLQCADRQLTLVDVHGRLRSDVQGLKKVSPGVAGSIHEIELPAKE